MPSDVHSMTDPGWKEVYGITSINPIYQNPSLLPVGVPKGSVYVAQHQDGSEVAMYSFNGSTWEHVDILRGKTIYYVSNGGTSDALYRWKYEERAFQPLGSSVTNGSSGGINATIEGETLVIAEYSTVVIENETLIL